MNLLRLTFALFTVLLITNCAKPRESERGFVLQKVNAKYKLTCLLSGETVDLGSHQVQAIASVTLRDDRTGRETRFKPMDSDSLYQSQGYIVDVWSPDAEYLVLPLGRFEGFALFKSGDVMDLLAASKSSDFIRVQMKSGVRLWHSFRGWRNQSLFEFDAGLSNQSTLFQYSALTGSLSATSSTVTSLLGINSHGEVKLSPWGNPGK